MFVSDWWIRSKFVALFTCTHLQMRRWWVVQNDPEEQKKFIDRVNEMDFLSNLLSAKKKRIPTVPNLTKPPSLVTSVPPKQKSPHSELLLSWIGTIQMGTISSSSSQLVLLLPISVISLPCFFCYFCLLSQCSHVSQLLVSLRSLIRNILCSYLHTSR